MCIQRGPEEEGGELIYFRIIEDARRNDAGVSQHCGSEQNAHKSDGLFRLERKIYGENSMKIGDFGVEHGLGLTVHRSANRATPESQCAENPRDH